MSRHTFEGLTTPSKICSPSPAIDQQNHKTKLDTYTWPNMPNCQTLICRLKGKKVDSKTQSQTVTCRVVAQITF